MLRFLLTSLMTRSATVLFLCALSLSAHAIADNSVKRPINIPPQSLATALEQLSHESGTDLVYRPDQVQGLMTQGAVGEFSTVEAATRLLEGTKLTVNQDSSGALLIAAPLTANAAHGQGGGPNSQDNTKETGKNSSQDFRVAQVDQGASSGNASVKPQERAPASEKQSVPLEEIVVTGSRLPLTAGQEGVQPVRSYNREYLLNSGQSTVGEFLNTLPDVSTFQSSYAFGIAGVQSVQLHGLPIGTTLTLLDGHRLETDINGVFDLGNIPVSAVERVEIVPVGASAVYGADALGGAVNFILRKNFSGFEANATLDQAPGVSNPGANLAWGTSGSRGSVSVIASFEKRRALLGTEREPISATRVPADFPAAALSSDTCAPGNVYSIDGGSLPGLSSSQAGIPPSITGVPTLQQFQATAGKLNICNTLRYQDIVPESQREGALMSAHYNVTESIDVFAQVLLSHRHMENQVGPQVSASATFGGTVGAGNPFNPFGQDVNVSFVYPGAGQQEIETSLVTRPMIGIRGSLFSDWRYEATLTLSQDRLHDVTLFHDFALTSAALVSSDPATALNPFSSGAPGSPQLLSSLTDPAVDTQVIHYDNRLVTGQVLLHGPAVDLPAGTAQALVGAEWGREKQSTNISSGGVTAVNDLGRTTYAAFSEARIPLLASGTRPTRSERLTLTLAGRYDHSNDYGGKGTWQGGLRWRAADALSFSGSYGLSYQAPRLSFISGPQNVFNFPLGVTDPFRGGELVTYSVALVAGPNFNLKPETGKSSTLGLEFASASVQGLHASLTWYDVNVSNYIGSESFQDLVTYPNLFPGAVVRAPATAQDQQNGFLGVITQLNASYYNFGDLHVGGFDGDFSYTLDSHIGQFTPSVAVANIYKWWSALVPGAPAVDGVGKATLAGVGWAPRWKGTAAMAWKRGPMSLNVAGRYVGTYLDYQTYITSTHEIGNTWIFDAGARYEWDGERLPTITRFANAYVAFSAINVFNKAPPFSYTPTWYDSSEFDVRGRFFRLSVGAKF